MPYNWSFYHPGPIEGEEGGILLQRTLTYFVRGNITVWLTSCLTGLDSAVLLNWNYKQISLFGQILTFSSYKVSECSLTVVSLFYDLCLWPHLLYLKIMNKF